MPNKHKAMGIIHIQWRSEDNPMRPSSSSPQWLFGGMPAMDGQWRSSRILSVRNKTVFMTSLYIYIYIWLNDLVYFACVWLGSCEADIYMIYFPLQLKEEITFRNTSCNKKPRLCVFKYFKVSVHVTFSILLFLIVLFLIVFFVVSKE